MSAGADAGLAAALPAAATSSLPRARRDALMAAVAVTLGLWGFSEQFAGLWTLWTSDALRSIGMLIPPTSLWLALRIWRAAGWTDWKQGGTWWGFVLMTAALLLAQVSAHIDDPASLGLLTGGGHYFKFSLIPYGLQECAYCSGAVLLFGGTAAWRRARFPLLLLLLVNPLPGTFIGLVDLPLQTFAAQTARGFAALIGVPVSVGTLKMMFSPQLGIFIAPGCDGLRGVTALGYLALVIGYLHKMLLRRHLLYVLAALALAYLLNLLRLCAVVAYYWVALRAPTLGAYGSQIDYAIGGSLFLLAAAFLFAVPRWNRP